MKTTGFRNTVAMNNSTVSAIMAGSRVEGTSQDIKVLSLDAETIGLWSTAFQIAAVLYNHGTVITFNGRCPIEGDVDPWVQENVLLRIPWEGDCVLLSIWESFFPILCKDKEMSYLRQY